MTNLPDDYEADYVDTAHTLELFAQLIRTGWVWNLRKPYPRTAQHLIDSGYITPEGEIPNKGRALVLDEGREGSPCDVNPKVVIGPFDDTIPRPLAVPNARPRRPHS